MDEKLNSTLNKIIRLCGQNAEFDKELRKRLGVAPSVSVLPANDERIGKIEKYLGLDYSVDSQKSTADYSFVKMDDVRNQLVSDNREMMRFRYGTRYHEIDFDEFCRYALLQSEMLLNYYYDVTCQSDLNAIIDHIKRYNPQAEGIDKVPSLSSISFIIKLWAFKNEHGMGSNLSYMLSNVRDVRNDQSHRAITKAHFDIEAYQAKLKSYGIPLYANGFVNTRLMENNPNAKAKYDKEIYPSKQYKQYRFALWYKNKPFEEIIEAIAKFSKLVGEKIKQNQ